MTATNPARRRTLGRALALLTASRLVQQGGSFVFGLLMRGALGPTKTGVWNYVDAWRLQLASLSAGVHYAADREMPMLRAQGRHREEDEMRWVTFTWMVAEALVLAAGFLAYWLIARDGFTADEELGLALVPALATITTIAGAYEGFLVNRKQFELRAWLNIAMFAVDWSLLVLVYLGGIRALLWGLLVTWVVRVAVYAIVVRRRRLFTLRLRFRATQLRGMLAFGLPVSLWNVAHTLLHRADSLLIGAALGSRQLGLYYLGPQIAASLASIPNTLSVVSYPELMETYGRHGMARLKMHIQSYQQAMLVMAPIAAMLGVAALRVIVEEFLPDFRPGFAAMRLVVVAVVFTQTTLLSLQILLAAKAVRRLILLTLPPLLAQAAVLVVGAATGGLDLLWIAWSALVGQASFAVAILWGSAAEAGVTRGEAARFWGRLPAAWAGFGALVIAVDELVPEWSGLVAAGASAGAKLALFAVVAGAWLLIVDRHAWRGFRTLMAARHEPV